MSERRRVLLKQVGCVLVLVSAASVAACLAPEASLAALRGAAGGANGNAGGFARFVDFINRLAGYLVPVGAAFSVLGLIWGGMLFQAGDSRAGRVLALVALGLAIVLLSKPIAA
jgi:hypothetical protein